jgi:hypothetical protein
MLYIINMKTIYTILLIFLINISISNSQIVDVNFGGGGSTSYSAWSNVNFFNYSGYGSFPGNQSWPSPIVANQGSATASLNRISGSPTGGGPYPASESIYFGNFAQVPNALGGTLRIFDSDPIFNLKTLVFQIQIGEATGFDFYQPSGFPKISINSGSYSFATYTNLVNRFQNGTFPSPETGEDEPVYVNTWAYQWNFDTLNGFDTLAIDFSGVTHSQIYALRIDGTSVLQSTPVIPEPSTYVLLILALGVILLYKKFKIAG